MKKSWFILLFSVLTFFTIHNVHALSYEEFQKKFQIINTNNLGLINSSEGKNIVVFMGATGAGKSTTLNFLNDIPMIKSLITQEFINSEDPNSFKIGQGELSQTLIPKYIVNETTNTIMYDFAGWNDNRETIDNLIGAAFTKRIIENAKTCRIVFVTSEADINSQKAINFRQFFSIAQKVFESYDLRKISLLVVTHANIIASEVKWEYLLQKLDKSFENNALFGIWKEPSIFPFSNALIDETQKLNILKTIELLDKTRINQINISHIYNGNVHKELGELFDFELQTIADDFFVKFNQLPISDNIQIGQAQDYLNNLKNLILAQTKTSKVIELFEPLSGNVYQEKLQALVNTINQFISHKTELLRNKKQDIEEARLKDIINKKEIFIVELTQSLTTEQERMSETSRQLEELQLKGIENTQQINSLQQNITTKTQEVNDRDLVIQQLKNEVEGLKNSRLTAKLI